MEMRTGPPRQFDYLMHVAACFCCYLAITPLLMVLAAAAQPTILPCSNTLLTNTDPSVSHLLENCRPSNGVPVTIELGGYTNLTIRNSLIGAVSVTALRWSTSPTSVVSLTVEDCTWQPASSSAGSALSLGTISQSANGTLYIPAQIIAIRRTAVMLAVGVTFFSMPVPQTSTYTSSSQIIATVQDTTISGSGWAPLISVAAPIQGSSISLLNTSVLWALPEALPPTSTEFSWISATQQGTNCSWTLYNSNLTVVRPTTLPLSSTSAYLVSPVTMINLQYETLSVVIQQSILSLHGGLLTSSGTLSLLNVWLSKGTLVVTDSQLAVNHTFTSNSYFEWTSITALSVSCTECAAFNVSGNRVSLWGSRVTPYNCYSGRQTIVQFLVVANTLTTSTTALIAGNDIDAVQNTTATTCTYRSLSFQLFTIPLDAYPLSGSSTVSVLVQDNQVRVVNRRPNIFEYGSNTLPVLFATLTSTCVGARANCIGVMRRNNVTILDVAPQSRSYAYAASVSVTLVMLQWIRGSANVSNNVACVTVSEAALLAASLGSVAGSIVGHASDVIDVWKSAKARAEVAASTMCGLDVAAAGSALPSWSVCGNTMQQVTWAGSVSIVGSRSIEMPALVNNNTIAVWDMLLTADQMLTNNAPQLSTLTIAVVSSATLDRSSIITGNAIVCKSSYPITARVAANVYAYSYGAFMPVIANNTIDVISYSTGSSYNSVSVYVSIVDTLTSYAPVFISQNFVRLLLLGNAYAGASLVSGTLDSHQFNSTLSVNNNLLLFAEERRSAPLATDASETTLDWLATAYLRGSYYGVVTNCSVPASSSLLTLVCNNTVVVARRPYTFPNTSTSTSTFYEYEYASITMTLVQSIDGTFVLTHFNLSSNWAVVNSTSRSASPVPQYTKSGSVSLSISWLQNLVTYSQGSTVVVEKNLGYMFGDAFRRNLTNDHVRRTLQLQVCGSVQTLSSSSLIFSRCAILAVRNSFVAYVPTSTQPAPLVGSRPLSASPSVDCLGAVLPSPSVLRWTNATITAPSMLACDNHYFAVSLPFQTTVSFLASATLHMSWPSAPIELYVLGNRVVAAGLASSAMTSITYSGPSLFMYDDASTSSQVAPLVAVADNSVVGSGLQVGVTMIVVNSLDTYTYRYVTQQLKASRYVVCNNTLVSTTRSDFASELVARNITALLNGQSRACPMLDDATRVVVCNNTVTLTNHTGALGMQWANQFYQFYGDISNLQPQVMANISVSSNDGYVYGASVLTLYGIANLYSDQRVTNLNISGNVLQTANLGSYSARAVSDAFARQLFTGNTVGIDVRLISSLSSTFYGQPLVVERNVINLGSNGINSVGPLASCSGVRLSPSGGGGLLHVCGNAFDAVHGGEWFNVSSITSSGDTLVPKTFQVMILGYMNITTSYSMTGALFTTPTQVATISSNTVAGTVPVDGYNSISVYLCSYMSVSISSIGSGYPSDADVLLTTDVSANVIDVVPTVNASDVSNSYPWSVSITVAAVSQLSSTYYINDKSNVALANISTRLHVAQNYISSVVATVGGSSASSLATTVSGGSFMAAAVVQCSATMNVNLSLQYPTTSVALNVVVSQNTIQASFSGLVATVLFSSIEAYVVSSVSNSFYSSGSHYVPMSIGLDAHDNNVTLAAVGGAAPFGQSYIPSMSTGCIQYLYTNSYNKVALDVRRNRFTVDIVSSGIPVGYVGMSFVNSIDYGGVNSYESYRWATYATVSSNTMELRGGARSVAVSTVSTVSGNFSNGLGALDVTNNTIGLYNVTNVTSSLAASVVASCSALVESTQLSSNIITLMASIGSTTTAQAVDTSCTQPLALLAQGTGIGQLRICSNVIRVSPLLGSCPSVAVNVVATLSISGLNFPLNTKVQSVVMTNNQLRGTLNVSLNASDTRVTLASLPALISFSILQNVTFANTTTLEGVAPSRTSLISANTVSIFMSTAALIPNTSSNVSRRCGSMSSVVQLSASVVKWFGLVTAAMIVNVTSNIVTVQSTCAAPTSPYFSHELPLLYSNAVGTFSASAVETVYASFATTSNVMMVAANTATVVVNNATNVSTSLAPAEMMHQPLCGSLQEEPCTAATSRSVAVRSRSSTIYHHGAQSRSSTISSLLPSATTTPSLEYCRCIAAFGATNMVLSDAGNTSLASVATLTSGLSGAIGIILPASSSALQQATESSTIVSSPLLVLEAATMSRPTMWASSALIVTVSTTAAEGKMGCWHPLSVSLQDELLAFTPIASSSGPQTSSIVSTTHSWTLLVQATPFNASNSPLSWIPTTIGAQVATVVSLQVMFACTVGALSGDPRRVVPPSLNVAEGRDEVLRQTVTVAIPVSGIGQELAEQVRTAARSSQVASSLGTSSSTGASVGRLMAAHAVSLCSSDEDAASAVSGPLGLVIHLKDCDEGGGDAALSIYRGSIVGNTALVSAACVVALMFTLCLSIIREWSATEALRRIAFPSSLMPAWAVVLPSTTTATVQLALLLSSPPCAVDVVCICCGALIVVGPLVALCCIPRWASVVLQPIDAAATLARIGWARRIMRMVFHSHWDWVLTTPTATPLSESAAPIPIGKGHPVRYVYRVLKEYRCLWYAPVDASVLVLISVLVAVSGHGDNTQCKIAMILMALCYLMQLIVCVVWRPFMTLFGVVFAPVTIFFTLLSSVLQLMTMVLTGESGNADTLEWIMLAASLCDLMVVGFSLVRTVVELLELAAFLGRSTRGLSRNICCCLFPKAKVRRFEPSKQGGLLDSLLEVSDDAPLVVLPGVADGATVDNGADIAKQGCAHHHRDNVDDGNDALLEMELLDVVLNGDDLQADVVVPPSIPDVSNGAIYWDEDGVARAVVGGPAGPSLLSRQPLNMDNAYALLFGGAKARNQQQAASNEAGDSDDDALEVITEL